MIVISLAEYFTGQSAVDHMPQHIGILLSQQADKICMLGLYHGSVLRG